MSNRKVGKNTESTMSNLNFEFWPRWYAIGSYTRVSTVLNVCFLISSACEIYYIREKYNVTHFVKTSSAVAEIIAFFLQFRRLFRLNLTISTCIVLILDSEE